MALQYFRSWSVLRPEPLGVSSLLVVVDGPLSYLAAHAAPVDQILCTYVEPIEQKSLGVRSYSAGVYADLVDRLMILSGTVGEKPPRPHGEVEAE